MIFSIQKIIFKDREMSNCVQEKNSRRITLFQNITSCLFYESQNM